MKNEDPERRRHVKIHGYVDSVDGDQWSARLTTEDGEFWAEMRDPLPSWAGEGSLFTIHRTKAGRTYLYWIDKPLRTKRDLIKAHQWAWRTGKALGLEWAAGNPADELRDWLNHMGL